MSAFSVVSTGISRAQYRTLIYARVSHQANFLRCGICDCLMSLDLPHEPLRLLILVVRSLKKLCCTSKQLFTNTLHLGE